MNPKTPVPITGAGGEAESNKTQVFRSLCETRNQEFKIEKLKSLKTEESKLADQMKL